MDNNLKQQLMEILRTSAGQNAKAQLKNMDVSEIEKKLMNVDKKEIIRKLDSMNLSYISQKLKNMSDAEIISALRSNPAFIDMLDRL